MGEALADPVAGEDCEGMLRAWAAVVTLAVTPGTRAGAPVGFLTKPASPLTDRQEAALRVAREKGKVTIADLRTLYPHFCSEVYRRDLAALVGQGRLEAVGSNRGRYYALRD